MHPFSGDPVYLNATGEEGGGRDTFCGYKKVKTKINSLKHFFFRFSSTDATLPRVLMRHSQSGHFIPS